MQLNNYYQMSESMKCHKKRWKQKKILYSQLNLALNVMYTRVQCFMFRIGKKRTHFDLDAHTVSDTSCIISPKSFNVNDADTQHLRFFHSIQSHFPKHAKKNTDNLLNLSANNRHILNGVIFRLVYYTNSIAAH